MKISELIELLQMKKRAEGNIEIYRQGVVKDFKVEAVCTVIQNGKIKVIIK